ncbi:MAG: hypothetical protein ACFB2Y_20015 [Fulvivirga sp.]
MFYCKALIPFLLINLMSQDFSQIRDEELITQRASQDRYASYSPDGQRILFESDRSGNWDIFIMELYNKNIIQLTTEENDQRRPSWHPNGDRVLFESILDDETRLLELDLSSKESKAIDLSKLSGQPVFASYSPDGASIALSEKFSDNHAEIVVINISGDIVYRYKNGGYRSFYPKWSPSGDELVFFSRHETDNANDEIYILDLDGHSVKRLTNRPYHNFCPAWSPDGSKIAFVTSMPDRRPEIYVMNSDGSNQLRITHNEDGDTLPSWSVDGKKLLITGYRKGNFEIVQLSLEAG